MESPSGIRATWESRGAYPSGGGTGGTPQFQNPLLFIGEGGGGMRYPPFRRAGLRYPHRQPRDALVGRNGANLLEVRHGGLDVLDGGRHVHLQGHGMLAARPAVQAVDLRAAQSPPLSQHRSKPTSVVRGNYCGGCPRRLLRWEDPGRPLRRCVLPRSSRGWRSAYCLDARPEEGGFASGFVSGSSTGIA